MKANLKQHYISVIGRVKCELNLNSICTAVFLRENGGVVEGVKRDSVDSGK